jgi:hypothetical protein
MMTQTKRNSRLSDSAVDGLIGGLAGGLTMAVFLVIAGLAGGEGVAEMLGRFSPAGDGNPLTGGLAHLAVAAIYGAIFGGIMVPIRGRLPGWVAGIAYGLVLFAIARGALLPGAESALMEIPPIIFLIAHVVYGGVLGWMVDRNKN